MKYLSAIRLFNKADKLRPFRDV